VGGEGGDESTRGAPHERNVQLAEQFGRIVRLFGGGSKRTDDHGDEHGGGKALAGDVANDEEESGAIQRQDLKEIAAYLPRRFVDGLDHEAGNGVMGVRQNDLLDLAGRCKFALEHGFSVRV